MNCISFLTLWSVFCVTLITGYDQAEDINENQRGRVKMYLYIGVHTNTHLKESLSYKFDNLRILTDEFEISSDLTTVCVYAYDINANDSKCASNPTEYGLLLDRIANPPPNSIPATDDKIFQKFIHLMKIPSKRNVLRAVIIFIGGQDEESINSTLEIWKLYVEKLNQYNITLILVVTEKSSQKEVEDKLVPYFKKGYMFVLPQNVDTILLASHHIKQLHGCDVYYPHCLYSDPQQTRCVPDWWRRNAHSEEKCQNNPGRGTPPAGSSPAAHCQNKTKCEEFCHDSGNFNMHVYHPDCRKLCGQPSGPIKNSFAGLWYAQLNCPITHGLDKCPACESTTTPTTTTTPTGTTMPTGTTTPTTTTTPTGTTTPTTTTMPTSTTTITTETTTTLTSKTTIKDNGVTHYATNHTQPVDDVNKEKLTTAIIPGNKADRHVLEWVCFMLYGIISVLVM